MLSTLKNQEFLPKMRALEKSVQSMATFQEQFAVFFNDKVHVLLYNLETVVLHTFHGSK